MFNSDETFTFYFLLRAGAKDKTVVFNLIRQIRPTKVSFASRLKEILK